MIPNLAPLNDDATFRPRWWEHQHDVAFTDLDDDLERNLQTGFKVL